MNDAEFQNVVDLFALHGPEATGDPSADFLSMWLSHSQNVTRGGDAEILSETLDHYPMPSGELDCLAHVRIQPNHLQNVDKRLCLICREDVVEGAVMTQLPCGHLFCDVCIRAWLSTRRVCPTCRAVVEVSTQITNRNVCALQQCRPGLCRFENVWFESPVTVLPNCSHVYHHLCARTLPGVAMDGRECTVLCVLCQTQSRVSLPEATTVVHQGYGFVAPKPHRK